MATETEWLEPTPFRELVQQGNEDALKRPGPSLLIVEGVSTEPGATVVDIGRKRFFLPVNAVEFVAPGSRVLLDQSDDQGKVFQPLGEENQPIITYPLTR